MTSRATLVTPLVRPVVVFVAVVAGVAITVLSFTVYR